MLQTKEKNCYHELQAFTTLSNFPITLSFWEVCWIVFTKKKKKLIDVDKDEAVINLARDSH